MSSWMWFWLMPRGKRAVLPLATVATAAGIFILDTLTNPEIAVAVLYVAVVLLAVRFLDSRGVLLAAAGCVALVVVSGLVTPYGEFSVSAFVDLLIGIAAIAITTYLALRNRAADEAFENELVSRVEARSREVLEVNRRLRSQIEQREKAEALVGQLQRFDAIGQITSGVAHDFNNLLSVVLTNARLLSRQLLEPDDQEGVDLIRAAAERGTKLTAQLLAFAREQRLEPQIVDLNQKVAGMRDLLAATLGDTVQLRALLHPQLWPALADPTQLEMIILNLAINGRDAMPSGGSMTIETFNTVIGDQPVRPEDPETGAYVGLAIRDTGTGIPEHALARAFEPFFTTKGGGKGSGLGLAQVFGFAKQSGGGVRIETRVGEGTCVRVFLPHADVDPKLPNRLESVASDQQSPVAVKISVLVVDDDRGLLRTTLRMLEFLGHQGISAESGREALDQLTSHPEIGLVLADFAMPEMNGIELAGSIQAKYPGRPVILVTGCVGILEQFKDAIILQKPFTEVELQNKITAAIESEIGNTRRALP